MTQDWSLSARSARMHLDCSPEGIERGCGGACCAWHNEAFWPANSSPSHTSCPQRGPEGCLLGDARPVTCHLYPFKLNPMNMLVAHFWSLKHGCCHPNTHTSRTIWESIRPSFEYLFGREQVERADAHIEAGADPHFRVPIRIAERYLLEAEWAKQRLAPGPFDVHGDEHGASAE